jgi:hypothetical protein
MFVVMSPLAVHTPDTAWNWLLTRNY